jgi:hypothetical protein
MITKEELADRLNGRMIGNEITKQQSDDEDESIYCRGIVFELSAIGGAA